MNFHSSSFSSLILSFSFNFFLFCSFFFQFILPKHTESQIIYSLKRTNGSINNSINYLLITPPLIENNVLQWFNFFDPSNIGLDQDDIIHSLELTYGNDIKDFNFISSVRAMWPEDIPSNIKLSREVFSDPEDGLGMGIAEYARNLSPMIADINKIMSVFSPPIPRQLVYDTLKANNFDKYLALIELRTRHNQQLMNNSNPTQIYQATVVPQTLPPRPPAPVPPPQLTPSPHSGFRPESGIESRPAPPMAPIHPPRTSIVKKALLIGINYIGQSGQLRGCCNDVREMYKLLTEVYRWDPACFRILTDEQVNLPNTLSSASKSETKPTKANILEGLRWLRGNVLPGDALFFHYSGHGSQQPDPNGIESDGMNETILPGNIITITIFLLFSLNYFS